MATLQKNIKVSINELSNIAEQRQGKCLSKEFWDFYTPLKWQCEKGHTWDLSPSLIIQGAWCPACNKSKRKRTIEEMKLSAKERGGICLSNTYINYTTKLKWKCKQGHIWEAMPKEVIGRDKTWCPECSKKKKHSIEQMNKLAFKMNGLCLSKMYINNSTSLKWKCANGHVWMAKPKEVINGTWCPTCSKSLPFYSKDEQKEILLKINSKVKARGGFCLSKTFKSQVEKLKWKCKHGHTWLATTKNVIQNKSWCPVCYLNNRKGLF